MCWENINYRINVFKQNANRKENYSIFHLKYQKPNIYFLEVMFSQIMTTDEKDHLDQKGYAI